MGERPTVGTGRLYPNDRKKHNGHPDWTGTVIIEGKPYDISLWWQFREEHNGETFSAALRESIERKGIDEYTLPDDFIEG